MELSTFFNCILLWNQTRIQKKMSYFRHPLWSFMILEGPWVRKLSGYFPFIIYDTWGTLGWRNCQATSLWYLRDLGGGYFPLITYDAWGTLGWGNCQVTSLWSPMILEGPWSGELSGYVPLVTYNTGGTLWWEIFRYLRDPGVGKVSGYFPVITYVTCGTLGWGKLSGYFPLFICATGGNLGWGNCHKMKCSLIGLFEMLYKCKNYVRIVTWLFPHPKVPPIPLVIREV